MWAIIIVKHLLLYSVVNSHLDTATQTHFKSVVVKIHTATLTQKYWERFSSETSSEKSSSEMRPWVLWTIQSLQYAWPRLLKMILSGRLQHMQRLFSLRVMVWHSMHWRPIKLSFVKFVFTRQVVLLEHWKHLIWWKTSAKYWFYESESESESESASLVEEATVLYCSNVKDDPEG